MKRYPLKFRLSSYTESGFYQLCMTGKKAVAPGERVSKLVVDTRLYTPTFARMLINPFLVQSWAFYVPYRLLWDQWVDFIAQDDAVTSVPVTTPAAMYLDGTSGTPNAFSRRAYKLIYNEFFGDKSAMDAGIANMSNCWFDDVNADAIVDVGGLLVWDQYRSHMRERSYSSQNYIAAVAGAQATIVLDDLARAIRTNNSRRRQKMTGDKYVDTMRQMGVELDWRVQMAPEFLGSSQQVVWPRERSSTYPATDPTPGLGANASCLDVQHQLVVKRPVAFAEHGLIVTCIGVRPLMSIATNASLDAWLVTQDQFFRPDTASGPMDGAGGGSVSFGERNQKYLRGTVVVGTNANNYLMKQSAAFNCIYPTVIEPLLWPNTTGNPCSYFTDLSVGGLTPPRGGR